MLRIGKVAIENGLVMAPMAGITDISFRLIVKRYGAGLVFTEMVGSNGLVQGNKKTREYLISAPEERPLCVQIFGSRPDVMAEATRIVVEMGADIVDINMGCPVKKVVKTGAGAGLLKDMELTKRVIGAVRMVCPVPLTIKIRAGYEANNPVFIEIGKMAQDMGVDAIFFHPRFATQGFSGRARWEFIRELKSRVMIPVIGNGDVFTPQDALKLKNETGCDGIMIGRGAVGSPWIFKQIIDIMNKKTPEIPTLSDRKRIIIEHYELMVRYRGERRASQAIRGMLLWYTRGLPYSSRFRAMVGKIRDKETLIRLLDDYFDSISKEKITYREVMA